MRRSDPGRGSGTNRLRPPLAWRGRRAGGEAEGEGGPLAEPALGPEAAVVGLDDVAADGEAEARAAEAGLVGAGLGGEEGLEDPPEVGRGDAHAGVGDAHLGEPAGGVEADADRTVPPPGIAWRALMIRFSRTCWICAGLTRAWGRPSAWKSTLDPVLRRGPCRSAGGLPRPGGPGRSARGGRPGGGPGRGRRR